MRKTILSILAAIITTAPCVAFSQQQEGAGRIVGRVINSETGKGMPEMIRLVPVSLREAALALGYTRWRTSVSIVLRTALPGIVTGALVAIARIAGETAPLLFTALGNQFWSTALGEPIAALPLQIFSYAISPYDNAHAQAWAGALVLISIVLVISLVARYATRGRHAATGD